MWPDWVLNPGPLTYESGALPTALRGPAGKRESWEVALRFLFLPYFLMEFYSYKK